MADITKGSDGAGSNGNGNGSSGTVEIEKVEVMRSGKPRELDARLDIECLLARWLVRAYLKKYGSAAEDEVEEYGRKEEPNTDGILVQEVSL